MSEASPSRSPISNGHVLLVDDEPPVLRAYARILRAAGFDVVPVSNGAQAADALAATEFDVVMSDIGLSDMSGIEVLRAVHARNSDLPVVLMTGGGDLESAVEAVHHGALRYLIKPVCPVVLRETAADATRHRRMARVRRRAFELYAGPTNQTFDVAALSAQLDHALATLHMAYQPIVSWSSRETFAHEALVRNGELTLARPDVLFSAAEQLGRLFDVSRAIRRHVAHTIQTSQASCVFVNLHPRDLEDPELVSTASPLSQVASRVVLEITERASLSEIADLPTRLDALRRLGFRIAVDDLGAGYAGLASFAQLEPDIVKLDMSLVRGVERAATKRKLIESMTKLCAELRVRVVAEGVETAAERDALIAAGCDLLQGYLFAKPGAPFPAVDFGD